MKNNDNNNSNDNDDNNYINNKNNKKETRLGCSNVEGEVSKRREREKPRETNYSKLIILC